MAPALASHLNRAGTARVSGVMQGAVCPRISNYLCVGQVFPRTAHWLLRACQLGFQLPKIIERVDTADALLPEPGPAPKVAVNPVRRRYGLQLKGRFDRTPIPRSRDYSNLMRSRHCPHFTPFDTTP